VKAARLFKLTQADSRGNVGEIEFAATRSTSMPSKPNRTTPAAVFFREQSFVGIVHHEQAALDGRDFLVGMEAEGDEITDRTDAPPRAIRCPKTGRRPR